MIFRINKIRTATFSLHSLPAVQILVAVVVFCALIVTPRAIATVLPAGFTEAVVADGLASPTAITLAPDGRIFILEQRGTIQVVENGVLLPAPYLTLAVDSGGERGLMGIAFDPEFATNHYFYVYYTATTPHSHNRVSRFVADETPPTAESEIVIIELPEIPSSTIWHMGGALAFGPDGMLYIGAGDHQNNYLPQTLNTPASTFGKLLRINKDGSIPADNPFYNSTSGINRSIWAYGLRNPYTMSFQPGTGRLFINDVGQTAWEEINLGQPGANYAWPIGEGMTTDPAFTAPFHAFAHADGACAITGGTFYNPTSVEFPAAYVGLYFFVDYCTGWIKTIDPDTATVAPFATGAQAPVAITTGHDGNLYYLSRQQPGKAFRIAANNAPAITAHPTSQVVTVGATATFTVSASGAAPLSHQWKHNGTDIPDATGPTHDTAATVIGEDGDTFSVTITNSFGQVSSNPATLSVTTNTAPTGAISTPADGTLFEASETIVFTGAASDTEDGTLAASALTWRVDFHHGSHVHPFIADFGGVAESSFSVSPHGHSDVNIWYRIHLTATDSEGLTTSIFRDIHPRTTQLTILSDPAGLEVLVDGQTRATPYIASMVTGNETHLEAPPSQLFGAVSTEYEFQQWSDGATSTHEVTVPATGLTVTAVYATPVAIVHLSDIEWDGEPINRIGPVEKDASVGGSAAGDGNPMELNGIVYAKGLGTHARSEIVYDLTQGAIGNTFTRLLADIGVDEDATYAGSVTFEVWLDDQLAYESLVLTRYSPTVTIDLEVANKRTLRLITTNGGDSVDQDYADWADARLFANQLIAPPDDLTATAVYSTVYLQWIDHSDNEDGFEIERAAAADGDFSIIHTTAAGATTYQDTISAPFLLGEFDYRVRAVNANAYSTATSPTSVVTATPPPGLIALYRMDSLDFFQLHDSSGNGNHAAITAATRSSGHTGGGLAFDSAGENASTTTSPLNTLTSFTLAGWIKPATTASQSGDLIGLFGQRGVASVAFAHPDILRLTTVAGGTIDTPYTQPSDEWHHIIAVGDSEHLTLYIDGAPAQTETAPAMTDYGSSAHPFRIGGGGILSDTDLPFTGIVDDVRIYSRALSASEAGNLSTSLGAWRASHFTTVELADPSISGPTANPESDPWDNLMEYGFRLDPRLPDPSNLVVSDTDDGQLALTFTRVRDIPDLIYIVEVSSDLDTWQSGPAHVEVTSVTDNGDGTERVTVRDKNNSAANTRFIRLRILQLPIAY